MTGRHGLIDIDHLAGHGYRRETVVIHPRHRYAYQRFSDTKTVIARVVAAIAAWAERLLAAKSVGRPYWLDTPALRVVCAWCPDFDPRDPANANATHGICPACGAKFEEAA